jgi:hypothetical protein
MGHQCLSRWRGLLRSPNQPHLISKNAIGNEPTKMGVFALIDKDQKLTLPPSRRLIGERC